MIAPRSVGAVDMTALFSFELIKSIKFKKNMEPKYPDITIQLTGEDGNAFFILSRVRKAMIKADLREEYEAF
jgi:hypothetical protein